MTSYRIGIDLGTSAVKVVALDMAGGVAATGEVAFSTRADLPGQAEQDSADWLAAVAAAVTMAGRDLETGWTGRVSAIGLAGQLPTLVCLGEEKSLGPAITWSDGRADAWASARLDPERRDWLYRCTGMPIDGRYLAPMFRFHWQGRRRAVRRILSAKDFLCHALTGRAVTDPSTAAGYGVYALAKEGWAPDLCAIWDLDPRLLPKIRPARSVAGPLHAAGAKLTGLPQGVPVTVGAADSVAAALAMGGLEPGVVSVTMGSSTVIMDAVTAPVLDAQRRYLLTPHAPEGWFGREMDLLATGTGFRWLANLLGWSDDEMLSRAFAAPPGANGLYFAPYLAGGEQGALWNPALRGALHGLTLQHTPSDIARAFLEGVQFEIRRCVDVLSETSPVQRVLLAGRAAESVAASAMLADILSRPVEAYAHASPAAVGAALLIAPTDDGAAGADGHGSRPAAAATVVPSQAAPEYERRYGRYLSLFPRVALMPGPN